MWKYALAWVPMLVLAIVNGAARESWYAKRVGALRAHQISTVTALILFSAYTAAVVRVWRPESSGRALAIGSIWLVLTLAFEFLGGHYLFRRPWSVLLHDYDLRAGRIWVLIPAWIAIAPYIFDRIQK